ncbi:MAG TPA: UBP-type zinc finger domain-containing protein [Pseudonocardia sp.]|jgi:uncharacterized UBP type Zn finger protein|nr:UBP-type zinc finger domain-containing protein [Pseudonocardia sp.]
MSDVCAHLEAVNDVRPGDEGCHECLQAGGRWVHLRMCVSCGHIGCCDSSPGKHATGHYRQTEHPLVRSFEPGEDWFWCYPDSVAFEIPDAGPAPSHP